MTIRQVMSATPVVFSTPTAYKGVVMRSALEARQASMLDANGWEWKYEPERFYGRTSTYLPDFWVRMPDGGDGYLELKGAPPDLAAIQKRMEIIWETKPDAFLCVIIHRGNRIWGTRGDDDRIWRPR